MCVFIAFALFAYPEHSAGAQYIAALSMDT